MLTTIAAAVSSGPQPALPGFLEALASPLEHYGLWAIFFLVLVEDFGIPVPGETVIIAASIYAGSGRLNVVAVGVVAFFAAVFGDNIGYGIGRFGGRRLVDRWGKYAFLTPERLDKAEEFFNRQGAKIITIARFIEGLRQANGIIAGITKMHWLRFIAYNALGAALWVGTWVSIGYFAGQHIDTIYSVITRYSLYVAIAAVVVIIALIARHVIRKRRQAVRPARPARPDGAARSAGVAGVAGVAGGGNGDGSGSDGAAGGGGAAERGGAGSDGEAAGGGGAGSDGEGPGRKAAGGGEATVDGNAAKNGEAGGARGTAAGVAGDREDDASAEDTGGAGGSGEAGGTEGNAGPEPSAPADAARTYAAPVDADHAGDADDGAESGPSPTA